MTTIEAFGQFRPFTIGFDSIFDKLSDAAIPHGGKLSHITLLNQKTKVEMTFGSSKWQLLVITKNTLILNSKKII